MKNFDITPIIEILETNRSHTLQLEVKMKRIVECCLTDSGGTEYEVIVFEPGSPTREREVLWASSDNDLILFADIIKIMANFEAQMAFADTKALEVLTEG